MLLARGDGSSPWEISACKSRSQCKANIYDAEQPVIVFPWKRAPACARLPTTSLVLIASYFCRICRYDENYVFCWRSQLAFCPPGHVCCELMTAWTSRYTTRREHNAEKALPVFLLWPC